VLNGVGAVMIIPKAIGMLIGTKELRRIAHGRILPVSGCIDVKTHVSAILSFLISA